MVWFRPKKGGKTDRRIPDRLRCKVCGKVTFENKAAAARFGAKGVQAFRAYYSSQCGCWHLTSHV